ncbi:sterol desaturase family protein [Alteraurantiacibacter aquimixticola]|uniref:Sterol desaturase family protein n=1 Tax=Alteraurantiacibacter aquimixticola TaxID=2489173 RepID=A0A4T3F1M6_9SPHN|nr:sterol desaturase family protein [Alteraurantiacibacter aquimixticola]TIX51103.1 sterol desaturase family protein [Alteraurantiacibacter aquimixticola]
MASRFLKAAGFAATLGIVGAIALAERRRPLRKQTRDPLPRTIRNAAMGAGCQAMIMVSEAPATQAIARRNESEQRGLQHALGGGIIGKLAAFLAMDYGFYLWHIATHKVPFLWRFHRVHHVDPDMDMSTAVRFHFLDMLISLPWRLVQVRVSGVDPKMLKAWQGFFVLSVLFHHSNTRLPKGLDEKLSRVITTPKMHGIHHSQDLSEMDSNWSSGIAIWDHLHGTYRDDVAQEDIAIGVDDALAERDVELVPALLAPARTGGARSEA